MAEITLLGWIYFLVAGGMMFWACSNMQSSGEQRRIERWQQIVSVGHFMAVIGWIESHRFGFSTPSQHYDPTLFGQIWEFLAVGVAGALAIASITINPGIAWGQYFSKFALFTIGHAAIFGGIAIAFSPEFGYALTSEQLMKIEMQSVRDERLAIKKHSGIQSGSDQNETLGQNGSR